VQAADATSPPLIAVVTPVYNGDYGGQGFLAEALESVQRQTYSNIVHVIRDNASTDSTPAIIDRFTNGPKPLLVSRAERTVPMADNWNAAVDLVPREAAYFSVFCADDIMLPTACEKMAALALSDPGIGIVGSRVERAGVAEDLHWPHGQCVFEGRLAIERILTGKSGILAPHLLWRRDALDDRHPFFPADIIENDTEAALFVLLRSKFGFIDEPLALGRVHASSYAGIHYADTHDDFASWLQILTLIGRQAIPPKRLNPFLFHFRMLHLRRMLEWRFRDRNRSAFDAHAKIMRDLGYSVGVTDFAVAMGEWLTKRMGLHPGHAGSPY
jgi:glycosyltransferase involved in cell wall biosynthesis